MKRNNKDAKVGIGNVLRSLRFIRDLSVSDLSAKMEYSSSYLCDIESNRKTPTSEMLEKYSKVLDVKLPTLLLFCEESEAVNYEHQKMLFKILQILETIETPNS